MTPDDAGSLIVEAVAACFKVPVEQLSARTREQHVALARHAAMAALRERLGWSYPMIAARFKRITHTSAIYGVRHWHRIALERPNLQTMIDERAA